MIEILAAAALSVAPVRLRDPEKCGRQIVARAERGQTHMIVPRSCLRQGQELRFPPGIQVKQGKDGIELWRNGIWWVRFLPKSQAEKRLKQMAEGQRAQTLDDKLRAAGLGTYPIPAR